MSHGYSKDTKYLDNSILCGRLAAFITLFYLKEKSIVFVLKISQTIWTHGALIVNG